MPRRFCLHLHRLLRFYLGSHCLGCHWRDLPSRCPCQSHVPLDRLELALELWYWVRGFASPVNGSSLTLLTATPPRTSSTLSLATSAPRCSSSGDQPALAASSSPSSACRRPRVSRLSRLISSTRTPHLSSQLPTGNSSSPTTSTLPMRRRLPRSLMRRTRRGPSLLRRRRKGD